MFIYLKSREKRDRHTAIFHPLVHSKCPQQSGLGHAEASSQEIPSRSPMWWQGSKYLSYYLLFSKNALALAEIDWKQISWVSHQHSDMACGWLSGKTDTSGWWSSLLKPQPGRKTGVHLKQQENKRAVNSVCREEDTGPNCHSCGPSPRGRCQCLCLSTESSDTEVYLTGHQFIAWFIK